jgi:lactoylglutathione lyase
MMLSHRSIIMSLMTTDLDTPTFGWTVLYVDDVAAALAFYVDGCGLTARFVHEGGDYAELDTGSTALALCSRTLAAESAHLTVSNEPTNNANITLVCRDVPSRWQHAIDHGATAITEPTTKPWGQVSAYVRTPDGHLLEIATAVS